MSKKNRIHKKDRITKGLNNMLKCEKCGALSYPKVFSSPTNLVEEAAILCGACHFDMWPILNAWKLMYEQRATNLNETELPVTTN